MTFLKAAAIAAKASGDTDITDAAAKGAQGRVLDMLKVARKAMWEAQKALDDVGTVPSHYVERWADLLADQAESHTLYSEKIKAIDVE